MVQHSPGKWRIVFWGTYDKGKPRTRLLLAGARRLGLEIIECHRDIWQGIEDKSQIGGLGARLRQGLSWLLAYPRLILQYLKLPPHDAVVVGYLGHLDVLLLWPFTRLRGTPVAWDAFLSLYDTIVNDRKLLKAGSLAARLLYLWEWLACRAADKIFLDTAAQARFFEEFYGLPSGSVGRVFVGAETQVFRNAGRRNRPPKKGAPFTVLFYGQFIPLHGLDTIVRAARLLEAAGEIVHWVIIGRGQEEGKIDRLITSWGITSIERVPWVPYPKLIEQLREADVCLGIFGTSAKARRVIPNKVFQILAAERPLITGDTPAVRELLKPGPGVKLVPPGDPRALALAVMQLKLAGKSRTPGHRERIPALGAEEVGRQLAAVLAEIIDKAA